MSGSDGISQEYIYANRYRPSLCSLPLQVAVYYNVLFSIIYGACMITLAAYKNLWYNTLLGVIMLGVWGLIEPIRLYCGYFGNLKESVANLSTFALLSLVPQMPFMILLGYYQMWMYPVEPVLCWLMFLFLGVELLLTIAAIRKQITAQTAQFMRLCLDDDDDHQD